MTDRHHTLRVELFGRFRVLVDGTEVPDAAWVRRQPKTLVKLLALAPGHAAHREALMEAMWPEANADSASNSLNKAIHAVRRALEPALARGDASAFLSTRDRQVRLHAGGGVEVDVEEFLTAAETALGSGDVQLLEAAVGRSHAELLAEDRYEPWVEPYRERVAETHRALVDRLLAAYERRGDLDTGARLARELLSRDAYDEAAGRRLMQLYARGGHRGRAVETYRELETRLRDELDAEPEEETKRLLEQIRSGELERITSAALREEPAAAAALPPSRLPRRATRFIGRDAERGRIAELLESSRIVTILGIGGIGKTRLAARVGQDLVDRFGGRVWMVELASVDAPDLVANAIADLFGVRGATPAEVARAIAPKLDGLPSLLVLDNCEHVVEGSFEAATELLATVESLRLLATSRERLGVEGEVEWRVTPLSLPPAEVRTTPAALDRFEATQLFVDSARMRDPSFDPSPRTAEAVAELCRRLDGIPLAIELAAACTGILSPEQLVERLDDRLDLPPRVSRGTPERHRSLRALLDWSHELLAPPERALLRRLAVFAGSFSLEAARSVYETVDRRMPAGGESQFLELLARLVDKSLVSVQGDTAALRYRLLETVHVYATEKLDAAPDAALARRAFAEWCAEYAESFLREVRGVNQRIAVERLNAERDNLLTALRWADERVESEPELAVRLAGALWQWFQRSRLDQGRAWLERAVAASRHAAPDLRARALNGLGNFRRLQGDLSGAVASLEECIALARESGDREMLAVYLQTLASAVAETGDYDGGAIIHREAAALCREVGEPMGAAKSAFALGVQAVYYGEFETAGGWFEEALAGFTKVGAEGNTMATLHNLAEVALNLGNADAAERFVVASIEASRRLGDLIVLPQSLRLRGDIAAARGNRSAALDFYRQAERIHRAQGDRPGLVYLLESLAKLEIADGAAVAALRLIGAAAAIRAELDLPLHPFERTTIDRCVADARTLVGGEAAAEALHAGELSPTAAVLGAVLA